MVTAGGGGSGSSGGNGDSGWQWQQRQQRQQHNNSSNGNSDNENDSSDGGNDGGNCGGNSNEDGILTDDDDGSSGDGGGNCCKRGWLRVTMTVIMREKEDGIPYFLSPVSLAIRPSSKLHRNSLTLFGKFWQSGNRCQNRARVSRHPFQIFWKSGNLDIWPGLLN